MNVEALVFVAVVVGMVVGFAAATYMALGAVRWYLGFAPRGGADVFVSVVLAVFLLLMLAIYADPHSNLSPVALLALPVCLAGLLFLGVGLFKAPKRTGERRDRLFLGIALMATAFVIVYLGNEPQGLFSDAASSVSGAPGP